MGSGNGATLFKSVGYTVGVGSGTIKGFDYIESSFSYVFYNWEDDRS